MTESERSQRNLNAHPAATFARFHWHDRYAEQRGGTMDFWDSLTQQEKRFCCEASEAIIAAIRRKR